MTEEQKLNFQAKIFENRITKKFRAIKKWARKNQIFCYRIYDRDIPEIPLAIDVYEFANENLLKKTELEKYYRDLQEGFLKNDSEKIEQSNENRFAKLFFYERPYEKDHSIEEIWLSKMKEITSLVLKIEQNHIVLTIRRHQRKEKSRKQYEKFTEVEKIQRIVKEKNAFFKINLTEYVDTGLFLDHRILRSMIFCEAKGKSVLNLFCYTASFSIFAALGGAKIVDSVDLNAKYLQVAQENFILNDFSQNSQFSFFKMDVFKFLDEKRKKIFEKKSKSALYDIIILDPPTFSNSKSTKNPLDLRRDWKMLVQNCMQLLHPHGILYFSHNAKNFRAKPEEIPEFFVIDLTQKSIGQDFLGKTPHKLWKITKK